MMTRHCLGRVTDLGHSSALDAHSIQFCRCGTMHPPHTLGTNALTRWQCTTGHTSRHTRWLTRWLTGLYADRVDRRARDHVARGRGRPPRPLPHPDRYDVHPAGHRERPRRRRAPRRDRVPPDRSVGHMAHARRRFTARNGRRYRPDHTPRGRTSHTDCRSGRELRLRRPEHRRRTRAFTRPTLLYALRPLRRIWLSRTRYCFQFVMSASSSLPPGCPSRPRVERSYDVLLWSPGLLYR
jgi:hypothetical protein